MSRVKQSRQKRRRQIDTLQLYKPFIFYTSVLLVLHVAAPAVFRKKSLKTRILVPGQVSGNTDLQKVSFSHSTL
jgi:hypothetical protein